MEKNKQNNDIPLELDGNNLYLEESFTDLQVGTIRRLTPVTSDGKSDNSRDLIFVGFAQLMSPKGPIPVQNIIDAQGLDDAIRKFPDAINQAVVKIIEAAQKSRLQESSRIVVPGSEKW